MSAQHPANSHSTNPLICRFYYRFVRDGNAADFISAVSERYSLATLHRLVQRSNSATRRGAVLALTFLGDQQSLAVVGPCLRDRDRAVRLIAADGIRSMWNRGGTIDQCQRLQIAMRLNSVMEHEEAIEILSEVVEENPGFAEAWHQLAWARFGLGEMVEAADANLQALESNRYHFTAALLSGQCYVQLEEAATALSYYEWALQIHPDLEFARLQVRRLERYLAERLDR